MSNRNLKTERNKYKVKGELCTLTITRRNGDVFKCQFDLSDLEHIQTRLWHVANRNGKTHVRTHMKDGVELSLPRFLLDPPDYLSVGHRNKDTLDCRRSNLFIGSHADICRNGDNGKDKHGYANIHLMKHTGLYAARAWVEKSKAPDINSPSDVCKQKVRITIGYYRDLESAKAAQDEYQKLT